jgi:hypothetical protein
VAKNTLTKCKKRDTKLKRFVQKNWVFEEKATEKRWHTFCFVILQRTIEKRAFVAAVSGHV